MSRDRVTTSTRCVIVGAGMAGLSCAGELQRQGVDCIVLEQDAISGGRLQTSSSGDAGQQLRFDTGAQYVTCHDARFAELVREWKKAGLLQVWSDGFLVGDGSHFRDENERLFAPGGFGRLASFLAQELDIRFGQEVERLEALNGKWMVSSVSGDSFHAEAVVLTAPVPQSLALLESSGHPIPDWADDALKQIEYEPCLALQLQLDGPSRLPPPGGMWGLGEPIYWMADNYIKGISDRSGAVTIHAGPGFSRRQWSAADQVVASELLAAARPWLDRDVADFHIVRWRYSKPTRTYHEACLAIDSDAPLLFAGDAFAGPRVEGAALSGLAAADWTLASLRPSLG